MGVLGVVSTFTYASMLMQSSEGALVFSKSEVKQIASWKEKLFHADDVFYHPAWGVLVANEGGNSVLSWRNGIIERISDPKKIIHDPDSLTATEDAVFVSDGSESTIFRYTIREGWTKAWGKEDGLVHPEALVAIGDTIYVLDESQKSITKLDTDKKGIIWKPEHPDWRAPESIAYDMKSKTLYVSDDVSGALFKVDFGKSIEKISQMKGVEDITTLPDGSLLATDGAERSVFEISKKGEIKKLLTFRRPYRDVQGIAVDEKGVMYIITADGFDSTSFMPSFLWSIPRL